MEFEPHGVGSQGLPGILGVSSATNKIIYVYKENFTEIINV